MPKHSKIKLIFSRAKDLLRGKNNSVPPTAGEMKGDTAVIITAYSQPHVLRSRMGQAAMTHGATVLGNISPVRLEKTLEGNIIMYFCPTQEIYVQKSLAKGDGKSLPDEATLLGIKAPKDLIGGNYYNLKNVILHSNGTLQVLATKETEWELAKDY